MSCRGSRAFTIPCRAAVMLVVLGSLLGTPLVSAHGTTGADHPSAAILPPVRARAATPVLPLAIGGQWSEVIDWPVIAIHAALLPNGKVLAWDATPDDFTLDPHIANGGTRVTLWDPRSDTHVETNNDTDSDLFCAGSAHLWDGRVLFSAGDAVGVSGPILDSNLYDYRSNTWHRTENLNAPRWYASVAALANGEMLTWGGHYDPDPLGEVFGFDQRWRPLGIEPPFEQRGTYQWFQAVSGNEVLMFGPQNRLDRIDTQGRGALRELGERDDAGHRDYGSYAMFAPDRILVSGGGDYQPVPGAVIVDAATNTTSATAPMNFARRQHNLTILADGSVLASGGQASDKRFVDADLVVLEPELWDPTSGQWTQLNPMARSRQYHSVALLLQDGRVLSGGGGVCSECRPIGYAEQNAEIYSPPYLFDATGALAARPILSKVPQDAGYGERIEVAVAHSRPVVRAHLIKLGSVTHSANQDQRLIPLEIESTGAELAVRLPDSRDAAPPGHYMLIAVDDAGVPSPSVILRVGQPLVTADGTVAGVSPGDQPDLLEIAMATTGVTFTLQDGAAISLHVATDRAAAMNPEADNLCVLESSANDPRGCTVEGLVGPTLFVAVESVGRTDYRLTIAAHGEPIPDNGTPPAPVGTGGDNGQNTDGGLEGLPGNAQDGNQTEAPTANDDSAGSGVPEATGPVEVGAGAATSLLALLGLLVIGRRRRKPDND